MFELSDNTHKKSFRTFLICHHFSKFSFLWVYSNTNCWQGWRRKGGALRYFQLLLLKRLLTQGVHCELKHFSWIFLKYSQIFPDIPRYIHIFPTALKTNFELKYRLWWKNLWLWPIRYIYVQLQWPKGDGPRSHNVFLSPCLRGGTCTDG